MWIPKLSILVSFALLISCADQYMVSGTSNVEGLEGQTLYLKVYAGDDMRAIDSSRVIHGKFRFNGLMDSVMLANVFVENTSVMPVVLEGGEVSINIGETSQTATGTPLNDSLCKFIQRKTQIDAQLAELPHLESQMIMNGVSLDQINAELAEKAHRLADENDRLVSRFISTNYNNVLGPGMFMIMTSSFAYPILNPKIDAIISQAPPYFLNHPYVRQYIKAAESNMEKLNDN